MSENKRGIQTFSGLKPEKRARALENSVAQSTLNAGMDLKKLPSQPAKAALAKAFINLRAICGLDRYDDVKEVLRQMGAPDSCMSDFSSKWGGFFGKAEKIPDFLRYIGKHQDAFFDALKASGKIPEALSDEDFKIRTKALCDAFTEVANIRSDAAGFVNALQEIAAQWRGGLAALEIKSTFLANAYESKRIQSKSAFQSNPKFQSFSFEVRTRNFPPFFDWLRKEGSDGFLCDAAAELLANDDTKLAFAELVAQTKDSIEALAADYPDLCRSKAETGAGRGPGGAKTSAPVRLGKPPPWEENGH